MLRNERGSMVPLGEKRFGMSQQLIQRSCGLRGTARELCVTRMEYLRSDQGVNWGQIVDF